MYLVGYCTQLEGCQNDPFFDFFLMRIRFELVTVWLRIQFAGQEDEYGD